MNTIDLAKNFLAYCEANPSQRFWQALRNWSGHCFIGVSRDGVTYKDTFHFHKGQCGEQPCVKELTYETLEKK